MRPLVGVLDSVGLEQSLELALELLISQLAAGVAVPERLQGVARVLVGPGPLLGSNGPFGLLVFLRIRIVAEEAIDNRDDGRVADDQNDEPQRAADPESRSPTQSPVTTSDVISVAFSRKRVSGSPLMLAPGSDDTKGVSPDRSDPVGRSPSRRVGFVFLPKG